MRYVNKPSLLTLCAVFLTLDSGAGAYFGGSGTSADPYQIATVQNLLYLSDHPQDWAKHFVLTTDIDLLGRAFSKAVLAWGTWDRGYSGTPFSGSFDGRGYKIQNLFIEGAGYIGLFGYLSSEARIVNLHLGDVQVRGRNDYVGSLVGYNAGFIRNCHSTGSVQGHGKIGGLVGCNEGDVYNGHSSGIVKGSYSTGGLVGRNEGTVSNCYSAGTVHGGETAGGLVGYNPGRISTSFSIADADGSQKIGGLVGSHRGFIVNCYSTGAPSGEKDVGGLVGDCAFEGRIHRCYSAGTPMGEKEAGGLVGDNRGTVSQSVWDEQAAGVVVSEGGVGLTQSQMKDPEMLGLNGFALDPNWVLDAHRDYPRLAWEGTVGEPIPEPKVDWLDGSGSPEDPFVISDVNQLDRLGKAGGLVDRHFVLRNDLDLSGRSRLQAVIPYFAGHWNGNGRVIRNLRIMGLGHLGLFGHVDAQAEVSHLGLGSVEIRGHRDYLGGLAGRNEGRISNCYFRGRIEGGSSVGGLVGLNWKGRLSHTYSYNTGGIQGRYSVGGLVGNNAGSITKSTSAGEVWGSGDVGGLVGSGSTGVTLCVWDVQSSRVSASAGGVGLSTAEMMDPEWLGLNGLAQDPNWVIDAHHDYPRLAWEGTSGSVVTEPAMDWLVGTGTPERPYELSTIEQIDRLRKASLLLEKHFLLVNDLDLSTRFWAQAVFPYLIGTFDGNGHVIRHLFIVGEKDLGLFGRLEPTAHVRNLSLDAIRIEGTDGVAGLAGDNQGQITNCRVSGTVISQGGAGGLVRYNAGNITDCNNAVTVSGDFGVGGLAGFNHDGVIVNSSNTGAVNGNNYVGGVVGYSYGDNCQLNVCHNTGTVMGGRYVGGLLGENVGYVSHSYNAGTVEGKEISRGPLLGTWCIGGLAGANRGDIKSCFNTGTITGGEDVGGLVGSNSLTGSDRTLSRIIHCYSTGVISGESSIGGLVGDNLALVVDCYSSGGAHGQDRVGGLVGRNASEGSITRSYSTAKVQGTEYVGGFLGKNTGLVTDCYARGAVTGKDAVGGLVGNNGGEGRIHNSYSTGHVSGRKHVGGLLGLNTGLVSACLWDISSSRQAESAGGSGFSSAVMQEAAAYLDEGWDFAGESENGWDDVWFISSTPPSYPQLVWELQSIASYDL